MGTTFYHANYYKNGKVDRKAECDAMNTWMNESSTGRVIKSAMVGSIYYAAVEITKDNSCDVVAMIYKTYGQDRNDPYYNFGYKPMDETMGPGYYDCPKSILDLLTPTEYEYAIEWRNKCRNKKPDTIKSIKIGQRVKWKTWDGREYILMKHAPAYQFKTWFWYNETTGNYVKKTLVNENNAELIA